MIDGALVDIKKYLKDIDTPDKIIENINNNVFSEVFIKGISDSNVLSREKKKINLRGNIAGQTHIDITGKSVNFFITEDEKELYKQGSDVNKDIYIRMIKNNFEHLKKLEDTIESKNEKGEILKKRKSYEPNYLGSFMYIEAKATAKLGHGANSLQGQINTPDENDAFNKFRKLIYTKDSLIFFKYRNCIDEYLVIAIPNELFSTFGEGSIISKDGNNVYSFETDALEIKKKIKHKFYTIMYNEEKINDRPLKMTETPYKIVEHYIKNNDVSFDELKKVFKDCKCGTQDLILELDKKDTVRFSDYFRPEKRPNLNTNGVEFGVNTQWYGTGPRENFTTFINNVIDLGYKIKSIDIENENDLEKESEGKNKIYFGAPGTGKSKYIDNMYYNEFAKRVTFHPEYTYNDFVGYIKPVVEGENLTYSFVPGVFTQILVEALNNPYDMYTLIIEELNRANVAAVFGDLFQLLDRKSDGSSEYRVNNIDIYKYIKNIMGSDYGYTDGSIGIPGNLNIIATMNTADQNVFVMDTAFKRRWEFGYIPINFDDHKFKDNIIKNLNVSWKNFVNIINEFMMSKENEDLMISEDKQIGQYFVKENELTDSNKFGYKVLLYLWDDVFKMDRYRIFNEEIRTFSSLIEMFTTGNAIYVFNDNISNKLVEKSETLESQENDNGQLVGSV